MQLIINDHAAFLGKHSGVFYVRIPDKKEQEFSADKIEQIIIAEASSISVGAIHLAMEREIDIVYLDWRGMPIARVYPCKLGGTTLTRKRQLESCNTPVSVEIIKHLIAAKIKNQAYLLKSLAKTRKNERMRMCANSLLAEAEKIDAIENDIEKARVFLLGIEGYSGSIYWGELATVIPLGKRDKEGSNLANALLNYGYGILYSEVEKACILAGLDPYLGYFHTDRYGKPSMVLDLIEEFRPVIVDRAVITLFAHKEVSEDDFSEDFGEGKRLSKSGREKIIAAVMERLHTEISFEGGHATLQDIILHQTRQVAKKVLDGEYKFRPFIYKW